MLFSNTEYLRLFISDKEIDNSSVFLVNPRTFWWNILKFYLSFGWLLQYCLLFVAVRL